MGDAVPHQDTTGAFCTAMGYSCAENSTSVENKADRSAINHSWHSVSCRRIYREERHASCSATGMDSAVVMSPATLSEPIVVSSIVVSPIVACSVVASSIIDSPRIGMASEIARFPTRSTILIVEDETFVREAMAAALRSSGYVVLTAADGHQALATCRNCVPPDLLLSDLVMPGMRGAHLATLFEAMYPWSHVLLMSGYAEELAPAGAGLSCTAQLRKPFSVSTLIKVVKGILDVDAPALRASASKP